MKITDLHIFDTVRVKNTEIPMQVVGIYADPDNDPGKGTVYLDFEGNQADICQEDIQNIERVNANKTNV